MVALVVVHSHFFVLRDTRKPSKPRAEVRQKGKHNQFTNPLLECGEFDSLLNADLFKIKNDVLAYTTQLEQTKKIDHIAIYFRDLNNGPWFGINEKEEFNPGSLLKVPVMIAVFKEASDNPGFLDKKVVYTVSGSNDGQHYSPQISLKNNEKYSVLELVNSMIKYSDNDAALLLLKTVDQTKLLETYADLGIAIPLDKNYNIQVRTYASFFRILYNATYLEKKYSELALKILSESSFEYGIRAGVPRTVVVADKFGERQVKETRQKELHNCGIVYEKNIPYILCIMTIGSDYDNLSDAIKNVSNIIFNDIQNANREDEKP